MERVYQSRDFHLPRPEVLCALDLFLRTQFSREEGGRHRGRVRPRRVEVDTPVDRRERDDSPAHFSPPNWERATGVSCEDFDVGDCLSG